MMFKQGFSIVLALFLSVTFAVDHGKFRRCDQTGFCKRHRTIAPPCYYVVDGETIKPQSTYIEAELHPQGPKCVPLLFSLHFLKNGALRTRILEKDPLNGEARWEDQEILLKDQLTEIQAKNISESEAKAAGIEITKNTVYLSAGGKVIVGLTVAPFSFTVYVDGKPRVGGNHNNKFYFEYTRTKDSPTITNDQQQQNQENIDPNNGKKIVDYNEAGEAIYEDGSVGKINRNNDNNNNVNVNNGDADVDMWEESWGGHTDTKKHGPQSVGMDIEFFSAQKLYGIPEHATDYILKPTFVGNNNNGYDQPYRMYNLDVFEFELNEPMALYGNIPFLIGPGLEGASAIFWHNPTETFIDIGEADPNGKSESYWMSEAGVIDLFIFPGTILEDIYTQYTDITGRSILPPLFSLGYHQSRWNYNSQDDVLQVDKSFEDNNFPYDVIWLDIEHTDGKRYFTYNRQAFPNPKEMLDKLWERGHRMVNIVDPHIRKDDSYEVDRLAKEKNLLVRTSSGSIYEGHCWPGTSHYMDHRNPEASDFWASRFSYDNYEGTTPSLHIWNDMNEPSVFNGPEVTMPKDCVGYDNVEHRYWHNVNGFYYTKSCIKGLIDRDNDKNQRPFILTRSFYAGSQRLSAVWNGDTPCQFEHLENAMYELLSMSTSSLSFYGSDIPGFFHSPSVELFIRGYQIGSWMPFFRAHAHLDSPRREPYLMGEEALNLTRIAVNRRYQILPYWYTLFAQSNRHGEPVIKSLWMNYPQDLKSYTTQDEYLVGDNILVHPIVKDGARETDVYFPESNEQWFDFYDYNNVYTKGMNRVDVPLDKIPVYQRSGSIIPLQMRIRRSSTQMINDPYTLIIAVNKNNNIAKGKIYIDDTVTFDYEKKNMFCFREISFNNGVIESKVIDNNGVYKAINKVERIVILNYKDSDVIKIVDKDGERELTKTYDSARNVLTIRKPDCLITEDWTITLN